MFSDASTISSDHTRYMNDYGAKILHITKYQTSNFVLIGVCSKDKLVLLQKKSTGNNDNAIKIDEIGDKNTDLSICNDKKIMGTKSNSNYSPKTHYQQGTFCTKVKVSYILNDKINYNT